MASCHTHAPLHAPLTHPSTHPSHTPPRTSHTHHTPSTHLFSPPPPHILPSASVDADIRIGRRRHLYRSTQTSVTVDADIRIGQRGCPYLLYSNIFFTLIVCKFQIILLYLQPLRRHKQPNTNIFLNYFIMKTQILPPRLLVFYLQS